jgi:hypothetical protein
MTRPDDYCGTDQKARTANMVYSAYPTGYAPYTERCVQFENRDIRNNKILRNEQTNYRRINHLATKLK